MNNQDRFELVRKMMEELIPFNREMGFKLVKLEDGEAEIDFEFQPKLVGNFEMNILHGGVIAAALDVVGATAVLTGYTEGDSPLKGLGTVDMRIDYLRPGKGTHFKALGHLVRPGKVLGTSRMELYNDDNELIAVGTAVYRVSTQNRNQPANV